MQYYARGETFLARAGRDLTGWAIRILKGEAYAAASSPTTSPCDRTGRFRLKGALA